ncbi:MAG: glycoside hydrolase family protein [Deltaproteobacteria bacterium]|nr:glycoside hydrolase family protein [Deltaproteobacteria bacterium]
MFKLKWMTVVASLFVMLGGAGCGDDADSGSVSDTESADIGDSQGDSATLADTLSGDSATGINESDNGTDSDTATAISVQTKSCKRGVAYGHHSPADMAALADGVSWWYNWYFAPDSELGSQWSTYNVEFVPMRWGDNYSIGDVQGGIPDAAQVMLGFNEPNFFSQANLSATQAATMWPELEAVADAKGLKLVSPAVNFCGGGCHSDGPVQYLNDFFKACDGCRVDAIAIHIYVGCDENSDGLKNNRAQWLINHVEMYKSAFDKPLWLTEFACSENPSQAEQRAFLEDAVAYLESEPRIERYAWFAGRADNMVNVDLLGSDGALTALGEAYVNAPWSDCE